MYFFHIHIQHSHKKVLEIIFRTFDRLPFFSRKSETTVPLPVAPLHRELVVVTTVWLRMASRNYLQSCSLSVLSQSKLFYWLSNRQHVTYGVVLVKEMTALQDG